jgi:hypothetical protein
MEVTMSLGCKEGSKSWPCTSSLTNNIDSTSTSENDKGSSGRYHCVWVAGKGARRWRL